MSPLPAGLALILLVAGCGHPNGDRGSDATGTAQVSSSSGSTTGPPPDAADGRASPLPGTAASDAPPPSGPASTGMSSGHEALCVPANEGSLQARLHGAIDAEIRWASPMPQCRGGVRPGGDGVRLLYKGEVPGQGPLLVVIGMGPLHAGESAASVPANITLVREGSGRFFATQGDDKCSVDDVKQVPVFGNGHTYRITGRGYCTQPARAVGGEGVVVVSRFDVSAVVDFQ